MRLSATRRLLQAVASAMWIVAIVTTGAARASASSPAAITSVEPANGSIVSGSVVLTAHTSGSIGDLAFVIDGTETYPATRVAANLWKPASSWPSFSGSDGTHTIVASGHDTSNGTLGPISVAVTSNNALSFLPMGSGTLSGNLTMTAETNAGHPPSDVEFTAVGWDVKSPSRGESPDHTASDTYYATFQTATVPDGTVSITATPLYATARGIPVTQTIVVNNTPVITAQSVVNGVMTIDVSTATSGVYWMARSVDGSSLIACPNSNPGNWSCQWTTHGATGQHTVSVRTKFVNAADRIVTQVVNVGNAQGSSSPVPNVAPGSPAPGGGGTTTSSGTDGATGGSGTGTAAAVAGPPPSVYAPVAGILPASIIDTGKVPPIASLSALSGISFGGGLNIIPVLVLIGLVACCGIVLNARAWYSPPSDDP